MRIGIVAAIFALAFSIAVAGKAKTQYPKSAIAFDGHHYVHYDRVKNVSWDGAREACRSRGATLAVVTSRTEAEFIGSLCDGRYAYLGASDAAVEGRWVWIDGSPWEFTHWFEGQPNDYGGTEDYLATYDEGRWVDVHNGGDEFWMPTGYVCEWNE